MAAIMTDRPERPPLSPADLAERWGCSTTLIYDLLAAGTLRGFKLGKLWRVPVSAVEEYETGSPPAIDVADVSPTVDRAHEDAATVTRLTRKGA
ncbi:MAG: hypothetical protein CL949_08375 [Erythrobacter sp.]|nr:hypothetical protein [Erythrobacter sp.]|tara:strand:+ start:236 stop:517 length:282 start_codon:yes stop_codon:yes gene_type:complete